MCTKKRVAGRGRPSGSHRRDAGRTAAGTAQELDGSTLALDREAPSAVIERIAEIAPETASGLRTLMQNYQTGRIRELLEGTDDLLNNEGNSDGNGSKSFSKNRMTRPRISWWSMMTSPACAC